MTIDVVPTGLLNLQEVVGDWHVLEVCADSNLNPIILSSTVAVPTSSDPNFSVLYNAYLRRQKPYRIYICSTGQSIDVLETKHFRHVQKLNSDEWLLVSTWPEDCNDNNAISYNTKGERVREFDAGYAIKDVQVSSKGDIWISYFDEGVYGSDKSISHHGLVCLDSYGQLQLGYSDLAKAQGLPFIDDCYALNVVSDECTFAYYYSDFPLVQLSNRHKGRIWLSIPIKGAKCFAVWNDWALLSGAYARAKSKGAYNFFLLSLNTLEFKELRPVDSSGCSIHSRETPVLSSFGRGSRLFLRTQNYLYRFDLEDVLQQLG